MTEARNESVNEILCANAPKLYLFYSDFCSAGFSCAFFFFFRVGFEGCCDPSFCFRGDLVILYL